MADQDRWGGLDPSQEHDVVTELWNWLIAADGREKAAERRHAEAMAKADAVIGAFAAGLRAFADALDRGNRR